MLVAILATTSVFAQQKQLELSVFSGKTKYHKLDSPYYGEFDKGWGLGFQAKYYLSNRIYWVSDIYFDTDDDTNIKKEGRLLSLYRRNFSFSTGFGADLISLQRFKLYLQAQGGYGAIRGHFSLPSQQPNSMGIERVTLDYNNYLVVGSVGGDFKINNNWSIGAGYRFQYLGDFDATHSLFARVSLILP